MSLADIALVALDEGAEGLMIPSKTFFYLAAGASVIGICRKNNDLRTVIEDSQCGICIPPRNPQKLASTIASFANNDKQLARYKSNARQSSLKNYSKKDCLTRLSQSLNKVIATQHKSRII